MTHDNDSWQWLILTDILVWLFATSAWLILLYLLYDYLVYFMIAIFCLFGSSAMITVIYNNLLIKMDCTHRIRCPKRHVPSWRCLDCIPHYLCRSGISVAGKHPHPHSDWYGIPTNHFFSFNFDPWMFWIFIDLVHFSTWTVGLVLAGCDWLLFLYFHCQWAAFAEL